MKICKIENCERKVHAKGLCGKHYKQMKRCGEIIDNGEERVYYDKCQVEGCNNKHCAKGLCNKHYKQKQKFGYIPERNMYSLNEIIKYDDYAEIILYDRQCNEVARALIDLDDIDKCKDIKWHIDAKGYVVNTTIRQIHRYIMDCPDYMVVDHINHNPLDNRKSNLRVCTVNDNQKNMPISSNSKTNLRGISIEKNRNKKYRVRLQLNGKTHNKAFYTLEDAFMYKMSLDIFYHKEYSSFYQLLNQVLDSQIEYTLDDLFNAETLEQVQEYINILFTDEVLNDLGLL